MAGLFLMTDASHYDVSYAINPWMRPDTWAAHPDENLARARTAARRLSDAIGACGGQVVTLDGVPGLPDMVFPANAAVVLDGRALMARFATPERRGEEAPFLAQFEDLRVRGLIAEVATLPEGVIQEGAGDCIWDRTRALFWVGHGQRSDRRSVDELAQFFGRTVVPLELVNPRFYHLDTCLCVLPNGEILYYPGAFSPEGIARIREVAGEAAMIEATDEDAARFCVNAVAIGARVVMAAAADGLKRRLAERGYEVVDVGLDPFILSGGGAYCMTLRLDLAS